MGSDFRGSSDWYDEDLTESRERKTDPIMAGLPASWRHYELWLAGCFFATLWLVQSWIFAPSISTGRIVWTITLAMGTCLGAFCLCRPYSAGLAPLACILTAIGLLVFQSF